MTNLPKRLAVSAAIAASLILTPVLAGCSAVEGIIENATGSQIDLGGQSVPADFPSNVPLASGDVIYGLSAGKDGEKVWNVTIKVTAGAFDAIAIQLTDAGFTLAEGSKEANKGAGGLFTSDTHGVLVVVSDDGSNGTVANYTVTTVTK
ncbi:hypothetical protein BKA04_002050 [Cryobacterium mesophilum]|uniref:Lipoprotein n=1 Tax=Terrimesophilobacter mesophilus TaxID=433647 RepID=A0A4R8VDF5_9MICO|nr:hypothetical protein [Terrimesophilobacter mesophilus]MBB5633827.1 hypothetical protein [Terrimesophilobacter mesophilus]TFB80506.1 hypothetical protein E3N84_10955 [Terrimesophilobacter mesophilus]